MRVYELAKQIGVDSKILMAHLQAAGFSIKNNMQSLEDNAVLWAEEKARTAEGFSDISGDASSDPSKSGAIKRRPPPPGRKSPGESQRRKPLRPRPEDGLALDSNTEDIVQNVESKEDSPLEQTSEATKSSPSTEIKTEPTDHVKISVDTAAIAEGSAEKIKTEPAVVSTVVSVTTVREEASKSAVKQEKTEVTEPVKPVVKTPAKEIVVSVDDVPDVTPSSISKRMQARQPAFPVKAKKTAPVDKKKNALTPGEVQISEVAVTANSGISTGHKHKRADFKIPMVPAELPPTFADLDSDYTRSIRGSSRRRGRRGRGQTQRPTSRQKGHSYKGQGARERDPNAVITLEQNMTLRELSQALGVKQSDIQSHFFKSGRMVAVNEFLNEEEITEVALNFSIPFEWKNEESLEAELEAELVAQATSHNQDVLKPRPPVVTFMGHVDHGKTSLLDKIRRTRVAAGEVGGITQHVGAYSVEVAAESGQSKNGEKKKITFLDTPGHEAFTAMRARGANLTDIAVLVVAADDGIKPQTEEAVSHALNAKVPIVVAINKCDLPAADPTKVRTELANRLGLLPEEWGGVVGMIDVSAVTGDGIDELLQRILLEADMLELKANPSRPATGHIIEARVSENRGVVATVLVADGTLRRGDVILCATSYGKVKLMYNEYGQAVYSAEPGQPVRIGGLNSVPEPGESFYVLEDIVRAREIAEQRETDARLATLSKRSHVTLENLQDHLSEGAKELKVIIKADVIGSLEVLRKTLSELATNEVRINIIHAAVGGINKADVLLADASDAIIVGFHVVADQGARLQAASHGVQIKIYHIIYRLIEDLRAAMEGLLPPEEREVVQGHVEIRTIFRAARIGTIAGCFVTDGLITRNSRVRVTRNSVVIYDGVLDSLRRFKDDVREVRAGYECGVKIHNYDNIDAGDILQVYHIEEVARHL